MRIALLRQFRAFAVVGIAAAIVHYGLLIGLREGAAWPVVPATLAGYVAGGTLSYLMNRRLTFGSGRSHREAVWRFALVAGVGFCLTFAAMWQLVEGWHAPYLPAQVATTGLVLLWSFAANRLWTFGH